MTRKSVLSRKDMTNEQAKDQVNLSEYATKVIRDTERKFGQKLSTDGWGKIMDYLEDMIYDTKSDLSDGKRRTKIEDYIYQIYESDIGIKDIYTAKSVKASRYSQAKAIVPKESKQRFCDLLDSLGIWYTTKVIQEGIEFTYGVSIGSKEFKKIDKFLDSVHSNIKGGTSIMRKKRFSVKASMSAKRRVLAMTDDEFYTRKFPTMKAGEVKVKPHRGNYTVFIGLSDGTIAYQWCESKVAAEREAKYVRDIVKKYGSDDDYWTREGYRIWNPNVKSNKAVRCTRTKDTSVSKEDVTELVQFIINRQEMDRYIQPVIANLKKHVAKGNYSADNAIKSWQRVADEGCAQYSEVFVNNRHSYEWLNPATRKEIAKQLQKYYDEQVFENVEASKSVRCARTMRKHICAASAVHKEAYSDLYNYAEKNRLTTRWTADGVKDYVERIKRMYGLDDSRLNATLKKVNQDFKRKNKVKSFPYSEDILSSAITVSTKRRFAVKASNVPESDADELYRVANNEVLPKTELYRLASTCDIDDDTFDYTYTGTAFGAYLVYTIYVGVSSSDIDLYKFMKSDWDSLFPDIKRDNTYGNYVQLQLNVYVHGEKIYAELTEADVYENDKYSDYYSKKFADAFDVDAIERYIADIADPAVNEIASVLSQYIPEDDVMESVRCSKGTRRRSARAIEASADYDSDSYKVLRVLRDHINMEFNKTMIGDVEVYVSDIYETANDAFAFDVSLYPQNDYERETSIKVVSSDELYAKDVFYCKVGLDVRNGGYFEISRFGAKGILSDKIDEIAESISSGDSVNSAKSIKCASGAYNDFDENMRFRVVSYYDTKFRDIADDASFDDLTEAEGQAHEWLGQGPVSIEDYYVGRIDIDPDEYWEAFNGEFACTNEIVKWQNDVWKSMGIGASKSIKCDDEIEDEITEDDSDMTIDISQLELSEPYYETREDDPENPDKWVLVIGKNPERHMNYKLWYYVDSTDADLTALDLSNPDHIDIDEESTFDDYDDIQLSQDIKCSTVTDKYGNSVNLVTM